MLKKLRGKFIIINMSLVITILIIVLGNFYHVNIWRLERQTEMALMQARIRPAKTESRTRWNRAAGLTMHRRPSSPMQS